MSSQRKRRELPLPSNSKAGSSEASSLHSLALPLHKQEWGNRGQDGHGLKVAGWFCTLNAHGHSARMCGSAPGQLSLEGSAPQCLCLLLWFGPWPQFGDTRQIPIITLLQTYPDLVLKSIFIIIAEPDCTWLFCVAALDKSGVQGQAIGD